MEKAGVPEGEVKVKPQVLEENLQVHVIPLAPTDPSAGLMQSQGHFIYHLTCLIVIVNFVPKSNVPSYCFKSLSKPAQLLAKSPYDECLEVFLVMHAFNFALLFFSSIHWTRHMYINLIIFKKLMEMLSLPFYIYTIFYGHQVLYLAKPIMENGDIKHEICVQTSNYGYAIGWILIEIIGFYSKLVTMVVFLAISRCKRESATEVFQINDAITTDAFKEALNKQKQVESDFRIELVDSNATRE